MTKREFWAKTTESEHNQVKAIVKQFNATYHGETFKGTHVEPFGRPVEHKQFTAYRCYWHGISRKN